MSDSEKAADLWRKVAKERRKNAGPDITVRYWHDTSPRRKRTDGTYPVRIIVYSRKQGKNRTYKSPYHFTPSDFESIWETSKPRIANKAMRDEMDKDRVLIQSIADSIHPFTFEAFERKWGIERRKRDGGAIGELVKRELKRALEMADSEIEECAASPVVTQYTQRIDELTAEGRTGSRNSLLCSLKSILKFAASYGPIDRISAFDFEDITPKFLRDYEKRMIGDGYEPNTVSIYLRDLRSVFNQAIRAGNAESEWYPFGRDQYKMAAIKKVNKALSGDDIAALIKARPSHPDQAKARDYFLFSYFSNGMNLIDIIHLRRGDIMGDKFTFYRIKTRRSNISNLKPITVFLNQYTMEIIDRQGGPDMRAEAYVFPILNGIHDQEARYRKVKNFTRYVNQHLKNLATDIGITSEISTYYARHSFANNMRNDGVPIQITMELMGHSNEKTHRAYLDSIPDDAVRKAVHAALLPKT